MVPRVSSIYQGTGIWSGVVGKWGMLQEMAQRIQLKNIPSWNKYIGTPGP
jgi:hypothetical protein